MASGWLRPADGQSTDPKRIHEAAEDWFIPIATFYHELDRAFSRAWHRYSGHANNLNWPMDKPPQLWKAAGDELLYPRP